MINHVNKINLINLKNLYPYYLVLVIFQSCKNDAPFALPYD